MSTPKATWTVNGKWVIPQRRVRVLFPEEGWETLETRVSNIHAAPWQVCLRSCLIILIWGVLILVWSLLVQVISLSSLPLTSWEVSSRSPPHIDLASLALRPWAAYPFIDSPNHSLQLGRSPPQRDCWPLIHVLLRIQTFFCSHLLSYFLPSPTRLLSPSFPPFTLFFHKSSNLINWMSGVTYLSSL